MISIVICSRDLSMLRRVSDNVEETIGVEYEIISIDNREGKYGICQAYNLGAKESKFDILCFMHEDLIFHSYNWGRFVVQHFQDLTIGLIGVAGGAYKSKFNSGWWAVPLEFHRQRLIQHIPSDNKSKIQNLNPYEEKISDVVGLDGLWFCTIKAIWTRNKFDEKNFKEFHFYDLDFCMQIFKTHRICVVYDILIEHLSTGSLNDSWIRNSEIFHTKWKDKLPCSVTRVAEKQQLVIEQSAGL